MIESTVQNFLWKVKKLQKRKSANLHTSSLLYCQALLIWDWKIHIIDLSFLVKNIHYKNTIFSMFFLLRVKISFLFKLVSNYFSNRSIIGTTVSAGKRAEGKIHFCKKKAKGKILFYKKLLWSNWFSPASTNWLTFAHSIIFAKEYELIDFRHPIDFRLTEF